MAVLGVSLETQGHTRYHQYGCLRFWPVARKSKILVELGGFLGLVERALTKAIKSKLGIGIDALGGCYVVKEMCCY